MNKRPSFIQCPSYQSGFTLVEMAIVLAIVGLLLGGLLRSLSAQVESQRINETRKHLNEIQQALTGYIIINGRLPCPASSASNGMENFAGGGNAGNGNCANFYNGFVPAATLGITPVDSQGLVIDAWNNPIRYAVTLSNSNAFTKTNGMGTTGISALTPNLIVCLSASAAGFSGSSCGTGNALTADPGVPAVIYSTGKSGGVGAAGSDEQANLDGNRVFVSHTPATDFDDLVIWLSPNTLLNRLVAAGKLP